MSVVQVVQNFDNGFIVEYAPVDASGNFTSGYCRSWILLPAENLWSPALRGFLYIVALMYFFIGVAIGSDVFMTSIEVITSKSRTIVVWDEEKQENIKRQVLVWNETVANLTLLALGSSAPEILLAVVETIRELIDEESDPGGSLGFYTIVGSAAFNLLVITGICIVSVPSPNHKKIQEFGVFILTAISSLLAYVWLLFVLLWNTPQVVEPWEAWVTLLYFPLLVLTAYAQDNGWWREKWWRTSKVENKSYQTEDETIPNGIESRRPSIGERAIPLSPEKRRKVNFANGDDYTSPRRNKQSNGKISKVKTNISQLEMAARKQESTRSLNVPVVIPVESNSERTHQRFARARFRHAAIRSLGGKRRIPISMTAIETDSQTKSASPELEPKLLTVVSRFARAHKMESKNNVISDQSSGSICFASPSYSVLESAGELNIDVLLNRRKMATGKSLVPITNAEGKFDTEVVAGAISVDYETREGSAKINKDFKFTAGTLVFTEKDFVQKITIPIINDDQYNPDTDFYILLKNPSSDATLGDPSVARITIIDDDKPGDFVLEKSQLYADMELGEVHAKVLREGGCDGEVKVHYSTIEGTAKGMDSIGMPEADYENANGILKFKHQETSKIITIKVNKALKETKNFVLVLRNPTPGSHLGDHSAAVANINLQPGGLNNLSRVLMEENDIRWSGQFVNAMRVGGEVDEEGNEIPPTRMSYVLHFLSTPWKLFFACTPPRHVYGGFPAFIISLLLIGLLTAVIEQMGHLLGCVAGLMTEVTGITIIALGTSLPDTIASRTAALQDDTADASIGNITGSNSVNVFLGLGLPWVVRTMYYLARNQEYRVNTKSLEFSVTLFDSLGTVCVILLIARRFILGGELGGNVLIKWICGCGLFLMWFTFILIASLKAHGYF